MKNILMAFFLGVSVCFGTENIALDSSMAAPDKSNSMKYEERVSLGPYFEISSVPEYDITYNFKMMNRPYQIKVEASNFYGLSGTLPLNTWVGLYAIGGYQYLEVKYRDRNIEQGYAQLNEIIENNPFFTLDSSAVEGSLDAHHFTVQLGFDAGIPLISSYNYQALLKIYGFAGAIGGRAIYRKTEFKNASLWGYSWGVGIRTAFHRISASFGFRTSYLYSRTYFEKPTFADKNADTFMMDPDFLGEIFFGINYSLY